MLLRAITCCVVLTNLYICTEGSFSTLCCRKMPFPTRKVEERVSGLELRVLKEKLVTNLSSLKGSLFLEEKIATLVWTRIIQYFPKLIHRNFAPHLLHILPYLNFQLLIISLKSSTLFLVSCNVGSFQDNVLELTCYFMKIIHYYSR